MRRKNIKIIKSIEEMERLTAEMRTALSKKDWYAIKCLSGQVALHYQNICARAIDKVVEHQVLPPAPAKTSPVAHTPSKPTRKGNRFHSKRIFKKKKHK